MSDEIPEAEEVGSELATVTTATTPVKASDLVARLATIKEAMEQAMRRDVDYGVIPGTNSKPTLLKPGAEKLSVLFQLDPQISAYEHWEGDHLTVKAVCIIYHAPTGERLGRGEGMCSTREKKYAYRKADRICPDCGNASIFKSKKDGEGFYCWAKKGGCGNKFADDDSRITGQALGDVDNPDLPDQYNTVLKMARKRALVDGVLLVTGASALFTQDLDDSAVPAPPEPENRAPFGPAAPTQTVTRTRNAVKYLLNDDSMRTDKVLGALLERVAKDGKAGEYYPVIVCKAIGLIASELKMMNATEHVPIEDATEGFGVCSCGWRGHPDELEPHIAEFTS